MVRPVSEVNLPRIYALVDGVRLTKCGVPAEDAAEALLEGGIRLLQFRWKEHYSRNAFAAAERIARLCRDAGAAFVVNDRADIAMLLDAGLHVGQDDLPPAEARALLGAGRLLGFSTHNERQLVAAAAEPVDYIAIGPIFSTATKANPDPVVGTDELRRLRARIPHPLVAIGGITRATAPEIWAAGADSIAVTADLYPEGATLASIRGRAAEWISLAHEYDNRASR